MLNDELGRGSLGYDDFISELAKLGGVDRETVLQFTENYYPNLQLLDYIRDNLKPKYNIGIISNAGDDWITRILGDKCYELFDDVVLSYKVGLIKPEAEIYEMSAKNLGVDEKECIFIDDILTYCQGAEQVGMSTIWYQNFEQFIQEIEKLLSTGADN